MVTYLIGYLGNLFPSGVTLSLFLKDVNTEKYKNIYNPVYLAIPK